MSFGIFLYFEVLSLLIAVFCATRKRNNLLLYFIPFLFLTVFIEMIGTSDIASLKGIRFAIYNLFTSFEFIFYFFLFYSNLKTKSLKKIILYIIPLFIFSVAINLSFIQGLNKTFHTYTFLLGSFFIVIFCCFFFFESVLPEKIDIQLSKQPFFWISTGLLIYYLGSVIINALFEYLTNNALKLEGQRIYGIINNSLIVILYSSYSIAFFLCPDNKKKSSSQL